MFLFVKVLQIFFCSVYLVLFQIITENAIKISPYSFCKYINLKGKIINSGLLFFLCIYTSIKKYHGGLIEKYF